jgi:hypothetical protein
MNIFEQASRKAYRFSSVGGEITTEQLWKLPLTSKDSFDLDNVAKTVNGALKATSDESFVNATVSSTQAELETKLEIVKYIIAAKRKDMEDVAGRAARASERARLIDILGDKQDEALKALTPEELQKRIAELA